MSALNRIAQKKIRTALVSINIEGYISLATHLLRNYALADERIQNAYEIEVLDFRDSDALEEILESIRCFDVICFSTYLWNIETVLALCVRLPEKRIVLGGSEISDNLDFYKEGLSHNTTVILREGELAFQSFLNDYLKGSPKQLYLSQGPLPIESTPSVYSTQYFQTYVQRAAAAYQSSVRVIFETMRGCPFRCIYCTWGKTVFSKHSLGYVDNELRAIFDNSHISFVYISDSDLFIDKKRSVNILQLLNVLSANSSVELIYFDVSPMSLTEEISQLVAQNKKIMSSFGLQTTNQETLKVIDRPYTNFVKYREKVEMHQRYGNEICFDVILGLPYETDVSYLNTLDFVLQFKPDYLNIFPLYVLPGGVIHARAKEFGIEHIAAAPYKIIRSRSIRNLKRLEVLSVWLLAILICGDAREIVENLPFKRIIDRYAVFIDFLLSDPFFQRIPVDLQKWLMGKHNTLHNPQFQEKITQAAREFLEIQERGGRDEMSKVERTYRLDLPQQDTLT